jgi:hypothetical protein
MLMNGLAMITSAGAAQDGNAASYQMWGRKFVGYTKFLRTRDLRFMVFSFLFQG